MMNYFKSVKLLLLTIVSLFISLPSFSQIKDSSKATHKTYSNFSAKTDSVSFQNKSELIEQLEHLEFVSGTVYFSGAGFPNVISSSLRKTTGEAISSLLDRCVVGSVITFEKCMIKDSDGKTLRTLHKSIRIR